MVCDSLADLVNLAGKASLVAPDADVFGDRRLIVETNIGRLISGEE